MQTSAAPVAAASAMRLWLIRVPRSSSMNMRPPPAPQQKPSRRWRGISTCSVTPDGRQHLARRVVDVVVAAEVAGVVVGDLGGRGRPSACSRPSRTRSASSSLWWTTSTPSSPKLGILVGDRVEAVRAGGDDLAPPCTSRRSRCSAAPASGTGTRGRRAGRDRRSSPPRCPARRSRRRRGSAACTSARSTSLLRLSKLPAQPTNSRYSAVPLSRRRGTGRSPIQSSRAAELDVPGVAVVLQTLQGVLQRRREPSPPSSSGSDAGR